MATPNVGILTTAGKALIDKVNSGQAKISFSKVVFSSMDNSQLSDTQIKALTAIAPQEVVVSSPQTTLDTNSGETRIRATGTNEKLADGVYVKTYGVFAKDDTGNEILYGVTVSPNPNYFPAYDGVTPQAVTYSYKTVIQETSNITMTNSNDVYVSQEDLTEAIAKIPQPDLSSYDKTDDVDKKLQNKQDKLGFTAADDSKVVHTSDMRKPASDVVGLEDITTAYNQGAIADGTDAQSITKEGLYLISGISLINFISSNKWWGTLQVIRERGDIFQIVRVADGSIYTNSYAGSPASWIGWNKLANDSKVAHLSGANNFDTVPTVNNNPLLLASSLPSDLARTSQQTNFTAGLRSGGVNVATAADLKSVADKAWYKLDNKYITPAVYTLDPYTSILYKIEEDSKKLYLQGTVGVNTSGDTLIDVSIDLTGIVKNILTVNGGYLGYSDGSVSSDIFAYHALSMSAKRIKMRTTPGGTAVIIYSPYITYDELV